MSMVSFDPETDGDKVLAMGMPSAAAIQEGGVADDPVPSRRRRRITRRVRYSICRIEPLGTHYDVTPQDVRVFDDLLWLWLATTAYVSKINDLGVGRPLHNQGRIPRTLTRGHYFLIPRDS